MAKHQEVYHWKSGHVPGQGEGSKWDNTEKLNAMLTEGWRISGYMQPATNGESEGCIYRSLLVILEKD